MSAKAKQNQHVISGKGCKTRKEFRDVVLMHQENLTPNHEAQKYFRFIALDKVKKQMILTTDENLRLGHKHMRDQFSNVVSVPKGIEEELALITFSWRQGDRFTQNSNWISPKLKKAFENITKTDVKIHNSKALKRLMSTFWERIPLNNRIKYDTISREAGLTINEFIDTIHPDVTKYQASGKDKNFLTDIVKAQVRKEERVAEVHKTVPQTFDEEDYSDISDHNKVFIEDDIENTEPRTETQKTLRRVIEQSEENEGGNPKVEEKTEFVEVEDRMGFEDSGSMVKIVEDDQVYEDYDYERVEEDTRLDGKPKAEVIKELSAKFMYIKKRN